METAGTTGRSCAEPQSAAGLNVDPVCASSQLSTGIDRFRRAMATIAAAIDLLVTVIKTAVIAPAL